MGDVECVVPAARVSRIVSLSVASWTVLANVGFTMDWERAVPLRIRYSTVFKRNNQTVGSVAHFPAQQCFHAVKVLC